MSDTIGTDDSFQWKGGSGTFNDPQQWIDLTTPTLTGTAYPDSSATVDLTSGEILTSATVATMTVDGAMTFDEDMGATEATNNGNITLNQAPFLSANFFSVGTLDNKGTIAAAGSAAAAVDFTSLTNSGSIGGAALLGGTAENSGTIDVTSFSVDKLTNNAVVNTTTGPDSATVLNNTGTVRTASALFVQTLSNDGLLSVGVVSQFGGDLQFGAAPATIGGAVTVGGFVFDTTGTLTVVSGATIQARDGVDGQSVDVEGGAVIDGGITAQSGTIASGASINGGFGFGSVTVDGMLNVLGGDVADGLTSLDSGGVIAFGSVASVIDEFLVGVAQATPATFDIEGGQVTGSADLQVDAGSTVDVNGGSSTLGVGEVDLGEIGSGAITVTSGGSVDSAQLNVGYLDGSTLTPSPGTVVVDAGNWTATGSLSVGDLSDGSVLIEHGGTFSGTDLDLAPHSQGVSGAVTVDGAGSLLKLPGGMFVVPNGGRPDVVLVQNNGSLLTGSAGTFSPDEIESNGNGTTAATVDVTSGGIWLSKGGLVDSGVVTADGSNTALGVAGELFIGAPGSLTLSNGATLDLAESGVAVAAAAARSSSGSSLGGTPGVVANPVSAADTMDIDVKSLLEGSGTIGSPVVGTLPGPSGTSISIPEYGLTLDNSGTIEAATSGDLVIDGNVIGDGQAMIGDNATLELGGSFGTEQTPAGTINFHDLPGGTLVLDNPAGFHGTIGGMTGDTASAAPDTIDLVGITANQGSYDQATGILSLYDVSYGQSRGDPVTTLDIAGTFSPQQFELQDNGNGGTDITIGAADPNVYTLAEASGATYGDVTIDTGYTLMGTPVGQGGFLAEAFQSESPNPGQPPTVDNNQVIVAFRGTVLKLADTYASIKTVWADASYLKGTPNATLRSFVSQAASFLQTVRQEDPYANITLAGHSLGAVSRRS